MSKPEKAIFQDQEDVEKIVIFYKNGTFKPLYEVKHTHEGTIGNLMNKEITAEMQKTLSQFGFEKVNKAIANLIA